MSLVYNDISDLELVVGEQASYISLNNVCNKLIQNDRQMVIGDIAPGIWECTWYSDYTIEGYSKGDAVWINAEDPDEFISFKYNDILDYIQDDIVLYDEFKNITNFGTPQERTNFLKKVAFGNEDINPIYYIGSLSDHIQIRISKIDDNKHLPTDDEYWEDFFVRTETEEVSSFLISAYESQMKIALSSHVENYHLPNLSFDIDIHDKFVKNDMSDVDPKDKYLGHNQYWSQTSAFNGVICLKARQDELGNSKWFRVWDGGILEHGGIVVLKDVGFGDSYTNGIFKINLSWDYDNDGNISPTYDYPQDILLNMYDVAESVNVNGKISQIPSSALGKVYRPIISITPILEDYKEPYLNFSTDGFVNGSISISYINNDSIGIVVDDVSRIRALSYHIIGYSTQIQEDY